MHAFILSLTHTHSLLNTLSLTHIYTVTHTHTFSLSLPIGDDTGVVADLVLINFALRLLNEALLLPECSDGAGTSDGLPKVGVDWGATG